MKITLFPVCILLFLLLVSACSKSKKLELNGDPAAINLAQALIDSMGGRKNWETLKSIYVRTVNSDVTRDNTYMLEEWINLDEPRFMNRETNPENTFFRILIENDGWQIQDGNVYLLSPEVITGMLRWHKYYLINTIKKLAVGGENIHVRLGRDNHLELYEKDNLLAAFEIKNSGLPFRYVTPGLSGGDNVINIPVWGEYKGLRYPLEVTSGGRMAHYKTDYFDPAQVDAEKAFQVTFDPYIVAEMTK